MLVAVRLDRITRRAHTLSQLPEEGISIRAGDMPGADDLMMRVYAAMAQEDWELISERTRAALAAARARGGAVLGGDRGWRSPTPPCASAAAVSRAKQAMRIAHRLALELEALRAEGIATHVGMARALTLRGVVTPRGDGTQTYTTVAWVLERLGACRPNWSRADKQLPKGGRKEVDPCSSVAPPRTPRSGRGGQVRQPASGTGVDTP
ncbi:recombinase family protein [Pararoseomonas sp. SCSIO 73927]|uniref:recombinase family protein n=1 Tax=Pararoseomonas sp. SCSIO 73927 TaxID=3114537 RepID=UPI0038D1A412